MLQIVMRIISSTTTKSKVHTETNIQVMNNSGKILKMRGKRSMNVTIILEQCVKMQAKIDTQMMKVLHCRQKLITENKEKYANDAIHRENLKTKKKEKYKTNDLHRNKIKDQVSLQRKKRKGNCQNIENVIQR